MDRVQVGFSPVDADESLGTACQDQLMTLNELQLSVVGGGAGDTIWPN